jgi:hypothetical protein
MSAVNLDAVGRTMHVLLERTERPVVYMDAANGGYLAMDPAVASAPNGFLPAVLVAGEAVWRETTGKGFSLDIIHDPTSLLGYRLRGIGAGSFATVMLASLEAIHQVSRPDAIMVSEFNALWTAATDRLRREPLMACHGVAGAKP